jgi:Tol biopolymer transport system component
MALSPGGMLSHYRLVEKIGEGGMGVVWKAEDTVLGRQVAIKVLPDDFAHDAERLARFRQEARLLASLNHPNIAAIYGLEEDESDGIRYLVLELVPGQTLAERIARGPLPVEEALAVCRQITAGLEAAHERGIIHRDLKPANVKVTPDGKVKVLDFGLAKPFEPKAREGDRSHSPTLTSPPTGTGMLLGTAAYMSPEQARGRAVDRRTDIWSFGCVLYEALSGRPAFSGETPTDVIAAVVTSEPDRKALPATTPPAVHRLLRRCLARDPDDRLRDAADARLDLDETREETPGAVLAHGGSPPLLRRWMPLGLAALGIVLGVALGAVLAPLWRQMPAAEPVKVGMLTFAGSDSRPSASPDGKLIAFSSERDGRPRIWIKQLAGGGEQPLSDGDDTRPRFSPDGASLLFLRAEGDVQSVYRQALVGGQPRKLIHDANEAAWSPDGRSIAFIRGRLDGGMRTYMMSVFDIEQGDERQLFESDLSLFGANWSPDGRRLCAIEVPPSGNPGFTTLAIVDIETAAARRIDITGTPVSTPIWNGNGRELIYGRAGSILGDQGDTVSRVVRRDLATGLETTLFHAEHLYPILGTRAGGPQLAIVAPGLLVFDAAPVRENLHRIRLGAGHDTTRGRVLTRGLARDRQPVCSRDGRRILMSSNRGGNRDLWLVDLETGGLTQLTDDPAQDWDPAFTPDERGIVWSTDRGGNLEVWTANLDGSGARQVTRDGHDAENPTVTPDGDWVVYWSSNPDKKGVWKIRSDGTDATHLVPGNYLMPEISPDGRWSTFISQEKENLRSVVKVADLATGEVLPFESVVPLPFRRADNPILGRTRWLSDGKTIAFVGLDENGRSGVFVQDFDPRRDTSGTRRRLAGFSDDFVTESFCISPDGSEIIIAGLDISYRLMLAENVPGVFPHSFRAPVESD